MQPRFSLASRQFFSLTSEYPLRTGSPSRRQFPVIIPVPYLPLLSSFLNFPGAVVLQPLKYPFTLPKIGLFHKPPRGIFLTPAQGIQVIGGADLIICGRQTTDGDTAQVGPL